MKILLVCSAGMSTSILVKKIEAFAEKSGEKIVVEAHGSHDAKNKIDKFDVILIGPQVRYLKTDFDKIADGKPVEVIPPRDYATANAENIVSFAKGLL